MLFDKFHGWLLMHVLLIFLTMQNQDSPAMRRRVRGILMSGRQFSLDSRMDLAIQGIEPSKSNGQTEQPIEETDEQEGTKVRY